MTTHFDFDAVHAALCKISRDEDLIHSALLIAHDEHERGRQSNYDLSAVAWCALKRAIRAESRHNRITLDNEAVASFAVSHDDEHDRGDVQGRIDQCNLSDRQRSIALALSRGDSRAQIGESLSISQATISRDVESIADAWRW